MCIVAYRFVAYTGAEAVAVYLSTSRASLGPRPPPQSHRRLHYRRHPHPYHPYLYLSSRCVVFFLFGGSLPDDDGSGSKGEYSSRSEYLNP